MKLWRDELMLLGCLLLIAADRPDTGAVVALTGSHAPA